MKLMITITECVVLECVVPEYTVGRLVAIGYTALLL